MARIVDTISTTNTPPTKTNMLWYKDNVIYAYINGDWTPISSGEGAIFSPKLAYANSKDGTLDFTRVPEEKKEYNYLGTAVTNDTTHLDLPETYTWNKIIGPQGIQGVQGIKGDQGPRGPKGDIGLTGTSYRTVAAYITYEPTIEKPNPDKPVGGSWDIANDIIYVPSPWSNTDAISHPIWMSMGQFSSIAPNNPTWTAPQRISGEKGLNGVDGITMEFIYCTTKNELIKPPTIINSNEDDYVPSGWSDTPKGISEEMQVEWAALRKKDSNGDWMDFEEPYIWSKWGVNGLDGDGVQYIFRLNNGELVQNPIKEYNIDVTSDEYQERGEYSNIEFIPGKDGLWTDNPQGVTSESTHEWCCKRKFRNGVWGEYSEPALWAKYAEDGYNGISVVVKYAVTDNSSTKPAIDATNSNPGSHWSKSIPPYESPEALWEIQAYIDHQGNLVEVIDDGGDTIYGWQGPVLKSGVVGEKGAVPNYKSTYYRKATSIPEKPTYKTLSEVAASSTWLDYPNSAGQWWQSTALINGTTEEIESWGNVLQVNGQDGVAQDGKYWETRFAASPNDSAPAINKTQRDPSTTTSVWIKVDSETSAPTVPEDGSLWQTWAEIQPGGIDLVDGWSDPFRISGERGPRGYQGATGEPGPTGVSGLHGVDFEILYCLGTETEYSADNPPIGMSYNGWSPTVPDIEEGDEFIYIWACQGRKIYNSLSSFSIEWEKPFRLSGTNGIGEKGVGVEDIRNYYAISSSFTEIPSDWGNEGEIPQLNEDYPYLWNYEVVEYSDGTEKETTPQVISVVGANGREIEEIIEWYAVSDMAEGGTHDNLTWKQTPQYPNDQTPYLWNYEEIVFNKGESIKTDPVRIGNYSVGEKGSIGKIVYPAGLYNYEKTYTSTETTCPYVLDSNYGKYYILNADKWEAGQSISPGDSYATNPNLYWTEMDFYEAIYAKVGVIANGLFGSVVFNGDYMFSQHGKDNSGNYSTSYHLFGQDINGNIVVNNSNFSLNRTDLKFYPTICFNFKTGSGYVANKNISWDDLGNVSFGKDVKINWDNIKDATTSTESINTLATQISNTEIIANTIKSTEIDASKITSGKLSANVIEGLTVDASQIKGLTLYAESIKGNTILSKDMSSSSATTLSKGTWYKTLDPNWQTEWDEWLDEDESTRGESPAILGDLTEVINTNTSGPSWQIHNSGTGYFAGGKFRWNAKGDVVIEGTINGIIGQQSGDKLGVWTVSKDNEGNTVVSTDGNKIQFNTNGSGRLAGGNITWTKDGAVTLQNNVTFGENVVLKWDNIDTTSTKIKGNQIDTGTITADNIKAETITSEQLATNSITSDKIESEAITTAKLAANSITSSKIQSGSITTEKLDANAILAENIKGTILSGKTVQSSENISSTNTPIWKIGNTGAGWLAGKNISWDTEGNLTVKGTITAGKNSQFGSWYTWSDGTIATKQEGVSGVPMIQFNSNGSGHLCNKNISWDTAGNLFIGSLKSSEEVTPPTVTIGDGAWITTADGGIKAANNNAYFGKDGSGYIGGIDNNSTPKGISWQSDGDIVVHKRALYKPVFIEVNSELSSTNPPTNLSIDLENSTYIIKNSSVSTLSMTDDLEEEVYQKIYLNWFTDKFNLLLNNGETFNCTIINHSDSILEFYINDENLVLPIRKKLDPLLSQSNYKLIENDTYDNDIINVLFQILYVTPGSKVVFQLEKYNDITKVYIDNIADFKLSYNETGIFGFTPNVRLVSLNYDINTERNFVRPIASLDNKSTVSSYVRNILRINYGQDLNFSGAKLIYYPLGFRRDIDDDYVYPVILTSGSQRTEIDTDSFKINNFEQFIIFDSSMTMLNYNENPITININSTNYTKLQAYLFSHDALILFESKPLEVELNKDLKFEFNEEDLNTLSRLVFNSSNLFYDVTCVIKGIEVANSDE